ncbi:PREDICTED: zona pellucida sperm-binding protein 3 [Pseudopodoces humilis]|uniref:zona pellucida sperm-binding protein 3 n=1 Tax=Pseudopodoces humilis TaxID=181119 RepID=UPI00039553ED|nr:PREDICTED: zona pellucida sperm-binding protein 3 [Pseudopodoces humilis]
MRSQIRLLLALLCAAPAAPAPPPWEAARRDPNPWIWEDDSQSPARSQQHSQIPVEVQCQEAQLVVIVHRDLFGNGRLVSAAELSLGPAACKYSRLDPSQKTVTFSAGLHECGSTVQVTPDSLIYRTLLSYDPSPGSNPAIVRSSPAVIPIECHYPRRDNVSSGSIRPTWAPFNSALAAEERLQFSLRLMNEDWSSDREFSPFRLGEVLRIQAEVGSGGHVPLRLFVDSCVASLGPGAGSEPRYALIDFHGCLVDGRSDATASAFVTPRPRQDMLRFQIDAFRFAGDARSLIYIRCHLKVTPAERSPDALNKACSFSKARQAWAPVEGTRDICGCCELGECGKEEMARNRRPAEPWDGHRYRRDAATSEADVVLGPVLLSSEQRGQRPHSHQGAVTPLALGTALAAAVATVVAAGAVLAIGLRRRNSQ